ATRAAAALIVVNNPTTSYSPCCRRRCSAQALSLPLLHDTSAARFMGTSGARSPARSRRREMGEDPIDLLARVVEVHAHVDAALARVDVDALLVHAGDELGRARAVRWRREEDDPRPLVAAARALDAAATTDGFVDQVIGQGFDPRFDALHADLFQQSQRLLQGEQAEVIPSPFFEA